MRKRYFWITVVLGLVLLIGGRYPLYYEIEPVSARLLDAETDEAISGAAVDVIWGMVKSTYHSSTSDAGWLGSRLVSTDSRGHFTAPGWERWWLEWFSSEKIDGVSPDLRILKSGYVPVMLMVPVLNKAENESFDRPQKVNFWGRQVVRGLNGQTIKLKKLPLEPHARYEIFHRTFVLPISHRSCKLDEIINSSVIKEIYREQKIAIQAGLDLGLSYDDEQDILDFKESNFESCIRLANYLMKQGL